jgi:hypothetical protein
MKPGVYDADIDVDGVHQSAIVVILNDNTVRAFDDRFLCYIGKFTGPNDLPGFAVKYDSNELLEVSYMVISETPGEDWIAFLGKVNGPPEGPYNFIIQASWSEALPSVGHTTVCRLEKDHIESITRRS